MPQSKEQRIFIKFCAKNGVKAIETLRLLQETFGENVKSKTQVYEWHRRFKNGRDSIDSNKRSGRPLTSKNEKTIAKIRELAVDKTKSVREIAQEVGVSRGSCQSILTDLGMRRPSNRANKKKDDLIQEKEKPKKKEKDVPFQHFLVGHTELKE